MTRLDRRLRLVWLALAILIIATACGTSNATRRPVGSQTAGPSGSTTSPQPSGANPNGEEEVYAQIESAVEALRGLQAKQKIVPQILDEKGVRDYMTKAFDEQVDPKALALAEKTYKHLGLLPVNSSLKKLEIDIESSQVIGFYDSVTKQLYLVSSNGQVGAVQKATFSHEFTHALQDQSFGLEKLIPEAPDQSDRDLARTALVEGDATLAMAYWAQKGLSLAELAELAGSASGPQQEALDKAPRILRDSLMFPYEQGLVFVQNVYAKGGWDAVDKVYASPPNSTAQILHPELYAQNVQPVAVSLPAAPSGFKLSGQDTFGEFQLGVWLGEGKATDKQASAADAASGWAGDRLGLYESPNGKWAIVIRTAWRSADARGVFRNAVAGAAHEKGSALQACTVGTIVNVVIASDAATLSQFDCGR